MLCWTILHTFASVNPVYSHSISLLAQLYFGSRHLLGSRFGAFMAARSLPLFGHKHFDGYAVVVLPSQTDRMVNREEFRHRCVRERDRDRDRDRDRERGSCRICAFTNYTGK